MITNECGIYKIKNMITGDFYIGSANNIRRRFYNHRYTLGTNCHENEHLQNAWNKYGKQAYEFTTVLLCDIENKLYYEQTLLDGLRPAYNMAKYAAAPMQGRHHSVETRAKYSEVRKGNTYALGHKMSEENRLKLLEANTGRHPSDETRRRLSEATTGVLNPMFGKHPSTTTLMKMRELNMGELNPSFGKHHTEESKQKISVAKKGKPSGWLGKHPSSESRTQMSESKKGNTYALGHRCNDETRAKMSEAAKNRWARQQREILCP